MKGGLISQIGTPSDIYRDPVDTFVSGFVGKVAFFPCVVKGIDDGCNVEIKGHTFKAPRWSDKLKAGDKALIDIISSISGCLKWAAILECSGLSV